MTTIIIRKNHEGIYRGFYCMGHAEYAKKRLFGKEPDILCAAISVTVQSTIMALDEMVDEKMHSAGQDRISDGLYGVFTAEAQQTVRGTVFASKNRGGVDHV